MQEHASANGLIQLRGQAREELPFFTDESPCPYLPDRQDRVEAYLAVRLDGEAYERLLGHGFRRCGRIVYRPRCRACDACIPIRVDVARFRRTRSLRRVWRRNAETRVEVGQPQVSDEKFELYRRYLQAQHDDTMPRSYETFLDFLYDPLMLQSALPMLEFCYYQGQRLIGVSLADGCPGGLSSVYMYFEPEAGQFSPGTFSILWEIEYSQQAKLGYYYLGYYIADCQAMAYKARFRPNERLVDNRSWVSFLE
ncbi:MAG TPA: arginyltransferase [Phycisphaerae bacterium]|nr:arginyltransferase [Phycisphaerae bacterium]HNU45168.1 arginyltransferase [Phycisphaerae bacterium]